MPGILGQVTQNTTTTKLILSATTAPDTATEKEISPKVIAPLQRAMSPDMNVVIGTSYSQVLGKEISLPVVIETHLRSTIEIGEMEIETHSGTVPPSGRGS